MRPYRLIIVLLAPCLFILALYGSILRPYQTLEIADYPFYSAHGINIVGNIDKRAGGKAVLLAPLKGAGELAFRFLRVNIDLAISGFTPQPLHFEIRGSRPDGPTLASAYRWKTPTKYNSNIQLKFFSGLHDRLFLAIVAHDGMEGLQSGRAYVTVKDRVADAVQTVKQGKQIKGDDHFVLLNLSVALLIGLACFLIVLSAKFIPERYRALMHGDGLKKFSLAAFAGIVALGSWQTYHMVVDLMLPMDPIAQNGQWMPYLNVLIEGEGVSKSFGPFLGVTSPGLVYFYALLFKAMIFLGVDPGGFFYHELGFRLAQSLLSFGAVIALYFFSVGLLKRNEAPGAWVLPLLPTAVLLLDPELQLMYLTPTPYALVIALFITCGILADRVMRHGDSGYSWFFLGLALCVLSIWRDEFLLVPFGYLLILILAMRPFRTKVRVVLKVAGAFLIPLLFLLTSNLIQHDKFAISRADHLGLSTIQTQARGSPDNPMGYIFEDYSTYYSGIMLTKMDHYDYEIALKALTRFFFRNMFSNPLEQFKSWKTRSPENLLATPSMGGAHYPAFLAKITGEIPKEHLNFQILLAVIALLGLAPTLLFLPHATPFLLIPGLCALSYSGFFASGNGYFYYAILTLALVAMTGLAGLLRWAEGPLPGSVGEAAPPSSPVDPIAGNTARALLTPTGMLAILMAAALGAPLLMASAPYDPGHHHYHSVMALARQDRLRRIAEQDVYASTPRIRWIHEMWGTTVPNIFGGYLQDLGDAVMFSRNDQLKALDWNTGEPVRTLPLIMTPTRQTFGFFASRENRIYLTDFGQGDRQWLRVIDAGTFKDIERKTLKYDVMSRFSIDEHGIYHPTRFVVPELRVQKWFLIGQPLDESGTVDADAWEENMRALISPSATTMSGSRFFAGLFGRRFAAMDKATGRLLWERQTRGSLFGESRVMGDSIIAADNTGMVYRMDAANGELQTSVDLDMSYYDGMELQDDTAYLGSWEGVLAAVDMTRGEVLWRINPGKGSIRTRPRYHNGAIYVGAGTWLLKLNAKTGKTIWAKDLGGFVRDTPLIKGNRIVVRCTDVVYGLEEPAEQVAYGL